MRLCECGLRRATRTGSEIENAMTRSQERRCDQHGVGIAVAVVPLAKSLVIADGLRMVPAYRHGLRIQLELARTMGRATDHAPGASEGGKCSSSQNRDNHKVYRQNAKERLIQEARILVHRTLLYGQKVNIRRGTLRGHG